MQQHEKGFEHTASVGGMSDKIKLFCLALLEAVASIFSLFPEVFVRTGFGRRYISAIGVAVCYYFIIWIYYISAFILWATNNAKSFKPTLMINPMGLQQPSSQAIAPAATASTETMFLALKIFVIVALVQRLLTVWRKIRHREASLTVYGGESIFAGLLIYIPESWVTTWAVTKDDFSKRYLEPACCYAIGRFLVAPLVDPLTGLLIQWTSLALFIRATCIRMRFQVDLDNTRDSQQKVGHLFDQLGESSNGHDAPVRARLN